MKTNEAKFTLCSSRKNHKPILHTAHQHGEATADCDTIGITIPNRCASRFFACWHKLLLATSLACGLGLGFAPHDAAAGLVIDSTGGTVLSFSNTDDAVVAGRSLGFAGSFFGSPKTTVDVSTNGNLNFSSNTDYHNAAFPQLGVARIAPLWDDLIVSTPGSAIEKVSAGNYYSLTWQNVYHISQPSSVVNAQVVWFGSTQTIGGFTIQANDLVFSYATVSGTTFSSTVGLNKGDGVGFAVLPGTTNGLVNDPATLPTGAGQFVLFRPNGLGFYDSVILLFTDLSLALDMREINLGVFETSTRDVNSRLFRLRMRSTEGESANVGLAAAYSSKGRELVSLGIDGKQTVNFKQTAPEPKRFEVFAQGDFSTTDRETTAAAAGFGGWTEAGTAGIEYSLTDRLTTGFAIGYVHNNTDIANGVGSIDIDGVAASLYASWFKNNFYVDGLYSFSYLEKRPEEEHRRRSRHREAGQLWQHARAEHWLQLHELSRHRGRPDCRAQIHAR
jgi:hypothetical protein